jgi:flagellar basal body rod protein FlgG
MGSVAAISASGMYAAAERLRSAAHSLANLQTEGFRRERVTSSAQANGGVTTSIDRADQAGSSMEEDLIAQLQARNAFLANLAAFRAGSRLGRVVDFWA